MEPDRREGGDRASGVRGWDGRVEQSDVHDHRAKRDLAYRLLQSDSAHHDNGGSTIKYHNDHDQPANYYDHDIAPNHLVYGRHLYVSPCDVDDCSRDHVYVFTADELHDLIRAALNFHDDPAIDHGTLDNDDAAAWFDNYAAHHGTANDRAHDDPAYGADDNGTPNGDHDDDQYHPDYDRAV